MKLENEICRKVYDHHEVLKGELGTVLLEALSKSKLDRNTIAAVVAAVNSTVDVSSSKLTTDYQKFFAANK